MNLKSKLFGTLAASAIALSMMGGIASAASSDSEIATATLTGACSVEFSAAELDFGTFTWNGTQRVNSDGGGSVDISVVGKKKDDPCNITYGFTGLLRNGNDTVNQIPASSFMFSVPKYGVGPLPMNLWLGTQSTPEGTLTANMTITEVSGTLENGPYSGTLSATIANGG